MVSKSESAICNVILVSSCFDIKYLRCKPRPHASVNLLAGVWLPCCMTSSSSSLQTCLRSMLLAMLTMKKELHGFLFLCMHLVLFLQLWAPLDGLLSCQSSAFINYFYFVTVAVLQLYSQSCLCTELVDL